MKVKTIELKWYVLRWNFNSKKVKNYNILYHQEELIAKEIRAKRIYDKATLKEYLKRDFMYHYWCKTECEFYVSDLHGNEYEKIDMWRQIEPNLDLIVEYVNSKMDLKFE